MKTLTSFSISAAQVTSLHKERFNFMYCHLAKLESMQAKQLQNTQTHYMHKLVYRVKDSTSRKIDIEIEPPVKWKPKLISYMLMKSPTFFSFTLHKSKQKP